MKRWQPTRGFRLLAVLVLALLLSALAIVPAQAADTRGGDQVVIGRADVVSEDLYVAANTVTIDGTVKGDLIAVGQSVVINGTVEGDLLIAAQAVVINGSVGDDARIGAQAIMIGSGARIGGDLAIGAASLESQAGSMVSGDLLAGAFQALLAGTVGRDVRGGMSRLELRGVVGRNVDVGVNGDDSGLAPMQFSQIPQIVMPTVAPNLTIRDSARIGGKLTYTSSAEATVGSAAQIGNGVAFSQAPASQSSAPARQALWLTYLQRLVTLLLIGALLLWLLPTWTRGLADTVERRPLPSLGEGLLAFGALVATLIGVLIVTIALAVLFGKLTLGGLAAMIVFVGLLFNGVAILGAIAFLAYIAEIVVGLLAGRWILRRLRPAWAEQPLAPMALGVVLYIALRAIPVVGGLLALVVGLFAMGALWEWVRAVYRQIRPLPPAPSASLQPA
jgi:cytoskeletal protein CcmA (bactofilin family)